MQASPRDLVQFAPCYTDILPLTRGKLPRQHLSTHGRPTEPQPRAPAALILTLTHTARTVQTANQPSNRL
jgi:hypothetical protein